MAGFIRSEYNERIKRLQSLLINKKIDLAILNQNSDLYYYSGSVQPLYLLVPASGTPIVLARKALQRIEDEVHHLPLEYFSGTKDLVQIINKRGLAGAERLAFTMDVTAYATVQRWLQLFKVTEVIDLSWDIRMLRTVKSPSEIAIQSEAAIIMSHLPEVVLTNFKPGFTELELSAAIENYFRLNGHGVLVRCRREGIEVGFGVCSAGINSLAGTKFDGICAGVGLSAAMPYGANYDPIPRGVPVVLDYAFNLNGYHVDQTRMFSWGKPSNHVMEAYQAMVQVEQGIAAKIKPGKLWCDVYQDALKMVTNLGFTNEFMGLGPEQVKFVGHGIGLELDEPPFMAPKMEYPLADGMVVAIEPKVALPEIGVIGIEDTLVIRDNGPEWLTTAIQDFIIID